MSHRPERLFTFGLVYIVRPSDSEPFELIEELDVRASNEREARARARQMAEQDYEPGWDRIVGMAPGGSGGFIQVWSS